MKGVDWLGNPLRAKLEYESLSEEPQKRMEITTDEHGRKSAEYRMHGTRLKYYIPFTKKAADDLLAKFESDKDAITYCAKISQK